LANTWASLSVATIRSICIFDARSKSKPVFILVKLVFPRLCLTLFSPIVNSYSFYISYFF
jgi:hypothetical protein